MTDAWTLDAADGSLTLHTGVTGRAARMGHRLTIAMKSWQISVDYNGDQPSAGRLVVEVDSLDITAGEGGVTPMTGAEKALARSNALKQLDAKRHPTVEFVAEQISAVDGGYRLAGPLTIRGVSHPHEVEVKIDRDGTQVALSCESVVSHKDFGVKQYSMMMGAMKVADEVKVTFAARHALNPSKS